MRCCHSLACSNWPTMSIFVRFFCCFFYRKCDFRFYHSRLLFLTLSLVSLSNCCVCSQCLSSVLLRRFVFLLGIRGLNYFLRFLLSRTTTPVSQKSFINVESFSFDSRPPRKSQHEVKSSTKLRWLPSLSLSYFVTTHKFYH